MTNVDKAFIITLTLSLDSTASDFMVYARIKLKFPFSEVM